MVISDVLSDTASALPRRDIVLSLSSSDVLILNILIADKDETMSIQVGELYQVSQYYAKCRNTIKEVPAVCFICILIHPLGSTFYQVSP